MSDLAGFLAARLDEDEAAAKAAGSAYVLPWRVIPEPDPYGGYPGSVVDADGKGVVDVNEDDAVHIARHDPARVLREVAAKRAILTLHDREHDCPISSIEHHPERGDWLYTSTENVEAGEHCTTLRHLAAAWSDHPDYDPAWA